MSSSSSELDADRVARVALNLAFEPGTRGLVDLVDDLGAASVVEALTTGHAAGLLGAAGNEALARISHTGPERVLEQAAAQGIRYITPLDGEWPRGLRALGAAEPLGPVGGGSLGLWVKGQIDIGHATDDALTVTGARSSTTYGEHIANDFSVDLARRGTTIVSGAAFGIDQAAHRGALLGGGTSIAVLACGVDRSYPAAHSGLLEQLTAQGAVVSELAPGAAPTRHRFESRSRIAAAISQGTLVVEAAHRSGALITAQWAERLGRELYAVPGPITSVASSGTNDLLRHGVASLVTTSLAITESLNLARDRHQMTMAGEGFTPPSGPHRADRAASISAGQTPRTSSRDR